MQRRPTVGVDAQMDGVIERIPHGMTELLDGVALTQDQHRVGCQNR
jgi:hypothetical protein